MADTKRYLNLITSQHQNKPKFIAWLEANLNTLDNGATLAGSLDTYFDLDTAVGAQLDILGDIVGVKRTVDFQPTSYYSTTVMGTAVLIEPSPILSDNYYRLVIRAKILKNMWDGTTQGIYDMWNMLFDDSYIIIKDNQDMSMTVIIMGLSSSLQKDLVANGYIIPKPQGVKVNYSYLTTPLFAFGINNSNLKGFNEGTWGAGF